MAGRSAKRARKKEAAAARRQARLEAMRRRRRARLLGIASAAAVLIVGGGSMAFVALSSGKPKPTPSPRPTPTPAGTPAPIACGGKLPPAAGTTKPTFGAVEPQKLNPRKTYIWRLETSCGQIDVKLDARRAPKTVESIVFLTRKGFYDGLTFHRNVEGFVIQGGDPRGDGTGGPGYKVTEPPPKDLKYRRGVVAMAKGGAEPAGTSGSQFFIVVGQDANLPPDYALVGEVVAGMEVADRIVKEAAGEPPAGTKAKAYIERATIIEQ